MPFTDWAARWRPVESYRPARVWIHTDTQCPNGAAPDDPAGSPRGVVLTLSPAEADDLPRHLGRLVEQARPGHGDHVTVDLGTAAGVHLTGLHLLLAVLWRRVGAEGVIDMTGGSGTLRARLKSLSVLPEQVRHVVFGAAPARPAPRWEPARAEALIPQQRQPDPLRVVLSGDLDISNAARHRTQLDELLATGVTDLDVDLSAVTFMDLTTLRILLQADAQLRARGGRLRLLNPCRLVRRLLAITATEHLAACEWQPSPACRTRRRTARRIRERGRLPVLPPAAGLRRAQVAPAAA